MRIAIMQPTYLPWMGYFDLIDRTDQFVFLDDVQFDHRSWQQRNRIKTSSGELMLTVPVLQKKKFEQEIRDVQTNSTAKWLKKHLISIERNYQKAPFFGVLFPLLKATYEKHSLSLLPLNTELIRCFSDFLGIKTNFLLSSTLNTEGQKAEKLFQICEKLGATEYLSPVGSFNYIEENNLFPANNIQLYYQHFEHPTYSQLYGDFLPYMSIVDLLFNEGAEKGLEILRSGQKLFYTHEEVRINTPKH
ncbi:MAG: WbqC family protein [Chitinophagales bacterium]